VRPAPGRHGRQGLGDAARVRDGSITPSTTPMSIARLTPPRRCARARRQRRVQGLTLTGGRRGQLLAVQDATAAEAPITATSAPGQAYTVFDPSERAFIAM